VRFNIRQIENGLISSALGRTIERGHRVTLTGPYGSAYFRPDHPGRIVLVAGGTGFAPIWAIAEAAIRERPDREMHIVVGTRSIEGLYMVPALCRIALFPHVTIIPVVSEPQQITPSVKIGLPTEFLPNFRQDDMVYVSGAPAMVAQVAALARSNGARCHSDAFVSHQQQSPMQSVSASLRSLMEGIQTSVRTAFAFRALAPNEYPRP
jgi:3-phenylpropionate/trans-cinnamate dioxygenase ferredoxin reductase subunit